MKIPTKRIDLGAIGYEGYWVEMPRSITEGWVHEFAATASRSDDETENTAAARRSNIKMLELVTDWNLDGDDGKVYPLFKSLKDTKAKEQIVSELPVDVLVHLAQNLTTGTALPDNVKDFSSRS